MGWPKRIVLVRHGESEGNARGKDEQSRLLVANHRFSLTERGRKQACAVELAIRVKYGMPDVCFVSTFRRTQETLQLMFPETPSVVDSRLNELWRGIWHTMSEEAICARFPEETAIREREGWFHYRPPGGQSCQDVELSIHSFTAFLREMYDGRYVFISAHGNWLILFTRIVQSLDVEEAERRYRMKHYRNGSMAVYECSSDTLVCVEDGTIPSGVLSP